MNDYFLAFIAYGIPEAWVIHSAELLRVNEVVYYFYLVLNAEILPYLLGEEIAYRRYAVAAFEDEFGDVPELFVYAHGMDICAMQRGYDRHLCPGHLLCQVCRCRIRKRVMDVYDVKALLLYDICYLPCGHEGYRDMLEYVEIFHLYSVKLHLFRQMPEGLAVGYYVNVVAVLLEAACKRRPHYTGAAHSHLADDSGVYGALRDVVYDAAYAFLYLH